MAALLSVASILSTKRRNCPVILYVHPSVMPGPAANTVQVAKMCDAFPRAGAPATLVQPGHSPGSGDSIAAYYGLPAPLRVVTSPAPRLPGRMLLFGAAACLAHGRRGRSILYTRTIAVGHAATRLGHRVVLEMHGPLWNDSAKDAKDIERFRRIIAAPGFAGLVVISGRIAEWFEAEYPQLRGRVIVAHDGADPMPEGIVPHPLQGDFKVGYTGHLYPGKGMEIIAALAPLCPAATFHVVGGLPEDIARWKVELAGKTDNIVFHGHQPHHEIPGFIAAMDVVLAPYLRFVRGQGGGNRNLSDWMSPLKLFEYMSMGKPILCSDLPVLREVVGDGRNARLADPDLPTNWAGILNELRTDPAQCTRLGAAAQQDFLEHYTWQKRAELILDGLDALATGDTPAPQRAAAE